MTLIELGFFLPKRVFFTSWPRHKSAVLSIQTGLLFQPPRGLVKTPTLWWWWVGGLNVYAHPPAPLLPSSVDTCKHNREPPCCCCCFIWSLCKKLRVTFPTGQQDDSFLPVLRAYGLSSLYSSSKIYITHTEGPVSPSLIVTMAGLFWGLRGEG